MLTETTAIELEPKIRWNVNSRDGEVRIMLMIGSGTSLLMKPSESNMLYTILGQALIQADIELGLLTDKGTEQS